MKEATLRVDYKSYRPKRKAKVIIKNTRYRSVLKSGQGQSYYLKPGIYKVKIIIAFLWRYKKWVVIAPTEEPVTMHISFEKGKEDAKIDMVQSFYSGTISRLMENKERRDTSEQNTLVMSLSEVGLTKMIILVVLTIVGCIISYPIAISTIIRFFVMLFKE